MTWLVWALFGNDEDGIYGFYPHTPLGAVRWWVRNPFHNFCFHVINWPGGPFWRYRENGWDIYAGWRPWKNGVLGFALRRVG